MADKTVEEMLAAHKAMVAAMSSEELAAHRAKIIADQLAHARANPYTGGERQAQAEMPKGFVVVADTDTSTAAVNALMDGVTEGPWQGFNMTHAEGRPMTPEEIGEYVCNSIKIGKPDQFLFIGAKHDDGRDCDVAHFGNGPRSAANMAFTIASRQLVPAPLAERDQWRETAMNQLELMNSTALREKSITIDHLTARVAELEAERDAALECVVIEATARAMAEAALAEIYRIVPQHRAGEIAHTALVKEPKQ